MTIRLLRNINNVGVANDVVSLNAALEARLVSANNAVYVSGPDIGDSGVPVMGKTDPVTGEIEFSANGKTALSINADGSLDVQPSFAKSLFRWISGDATTATSVAVGTPVTTDAIDVNSVADGSLFSVHTGGTLSISYDVSDDGVLWIPGGSLLSGLAAGTYAALLSSIKLESGFFRLTFTATGSTASVKSFFCGTSANAAMKTRQIKRGVFGDGSASIAMSASSTIVSPPIDLTKCVRSKSSIKIVVASGTVKVSASISRDGINDLYSLGDLATGLSAGTTTINLSSLAQYGHFLTLTLTETAAAAASASGYALLSVADEHVSSRDVRRAAVIGPRLGYAGSEWTTNYSKSTMSMYSMLLRMGYDAEILPLDDASPLLDSGAKTHEFFVWPHTAHSGLWTTWNSGSGKPIGRLVKGETAIPLFCVGVTSSNNATLLANLGAGVRDTETYRKILVGVNSLPWYAANVGSYTVTVQAHMGSFKTIATDSTASGKTAWAFTGAKGRVYVGAGFNGSGDSNSFPILFAEAINEGVVSAPPRKLKTVIDIDDMPACDGGATGVMTLADLTRVYAAMTALSMPCSFGIRVEDISAGRQSAALSTFVIDRSFDRGGLIYPIVHNGNWFWKDGTKSTKDAAYRADVAVAIGAGIKVGTDSSQLNAWGYTYFNNNAFDEETTQLGEPDKSCAASVDNLSIKSGYGWKVIRADALGGNNTEGFGEPAAVFGQTWHRGIRVVASHNHIGSASKAIDFDDGAAGTTLIALQNARLINYSLAYGMPYYIHGQNCFDGHDSGDAPGTRWLEMVAGLYSYGLSNFVEFVHGSALATEI